MVLPGDLRKYRTKKILKSVIPFIVLFSVSVITCFWLSRKVPALENTTDSRVIATYIFVMALPFFITGFPVKLIDKSWCGEIVDISVEFNNTLYTLKNCGTYCKASILLKVKLSNNKIKEITSYTTLEPKEVSHYSSINWKPDGKLEYQISQYSIGDKVYHLYLFEHLLIGNKNDKTVTCIVCGAVNSQENEKCVMCNHSILKN